MRLERDNTPSVKMEKTGRLGGYYLIVTKCNSALCQRNENRH